MTQNYKATPFRVLHIMSSFGGGISTFIMNIAREIQAYGIVFDVVTYHEVSDEFLKAIKKTGGDVYQLKNPKVSGWRAFKSSYTKVLDLYSYDAIHCHISGYRALVYKLLSQPFGVKRFYIHAHYLMDDDSKRPRTILMNSVNRHINRNLSDGYIGCSSLAIKSIFGYEVPNNQMMKIPNSIEPKDFLLAETEFMTLRAKGRQALGISEGDLIFGQVGRLDPIKNHQKTFEIAMFMKANHLPGKFLIVGSGAMEAKIKQMIVKNELQEQVEFIGRVQPIAPFLPVLDSMIFPSLREGLGTVAIEGQAANIPVVISRNLPQEVDLNIGLLKRLNLNDPAEDWYHALVEASQGASVPIKDRESALHGNQYTNEEAARLYARYIGEQN